MKLNDELEAVKFLESKGVVVTIEQYIFLPKSGIYGDEVHETIDYLVTVWDYILNYTFNVEHPAI